MWKSKNYSKSKSRITFVKFYFEFTINSSILWILSNFVIKSIRITIIINVIDRDIRIFILFFIKQYFFFASSLFRSGKNSSKWFQWCKNNKICFKCNSSNYKSNVCRYFFRFDFRFRKFQKRFSYFKFIFRNNSFHSRFRTSHFRFRFRF